MSINRPTGDRQKSQKPQTTSIIPQRQADVEITSHLLQDVIREEDPLALQRNNKGVFPLMANVPASMDQWYQCESDNVFSIASSIVSPNRNALKRKKLNMLVFLAKNLYCLMDALLHCIFII